jgi:hypothetical protein
MFMGLFNGKVDDFMSDELSLPDEWPARDNFRKYIWTDSKYAKKKIKIDGITRLWVMLY